MDDLLAAARDAAETAHVPHSDYRVGAAVRTADGTVFPGTNVETGNVANTLHAEEVAVGAAVTAGHAAIVAVAVVSGERDGVTPCGHCRETLSSFGDDDLAVYCDAGDRVEEYTLSALLPHGGPQ